MFGGVDLKSGFYQIRMEESSIPITAFTTVAGLHEYCVMPFGLCNAPSHFMSQIDLMLTEHKLHDICEAFVDDLTTHGRGVD